MFYDLSSFRVRHAVRQSDAILLRRQQTIALLLRSSQFLLRAVNPVLFLSSWLSLRRIIPSIQLVLVVCHMPKPMAIHDRNLLSLIVRSNIFRFVCTWPRTLPFHVVPSIPRWTWNMWYAAPICKDLSLNTFCLSTDLCSYVKLSVHPVEVGRRGMACCYWWRVYFFAYLLTILNENDYSYRPGTFRKDWQWCWDRAIKVCTKLRQIPDRWTTKAANYWWTPIKWGGGDLCVESTCSELFCFDFLPRSALYARPLPSCGVCLSVLLSVTIVYCAKTSNHILKLFSLSGSHSILAFFRTKHYSNIPTGTS